jgi:hypothetical protein
MAAASLERYHQFSSHKIKGALPRCTSTISALFLHHIPQAALPGKNRQEEGKKLLPAGGGFLFKDLFFCYIVIKPC